MVVHKDIQFLTPFKVHDTLSIIHHSEPLKKTVLFLIITTLMNTIYWAPNMCSLGEGGNILFLTISGMRKLRLRDLSDLSTFSRAWRGAWTKAGISNSGPNPVTLRLMFSKWHGLKEIMWKEHGVSCSRSSHCVQDDRVASWMQEQWK